MTMTSFVYFLFSGDLHFAYALPEDDLSGGIYKCTTYNPHLDVKAGGSYTKLTVTRSMNVLQLIGLSKQYGLTK